MYRHRLANLRDSGVTITADSLLSIILHCSIAHGTDLRHEFDSAVDRELSVDREVPLSFNDHINILTACQEKVRAREAERHCDPLPAGFSSSAISQPPACSASVESHPDNIYVLADFRHNLPPPPGLHGPQYQAYYPILAPPFPPFAPYLPPPPPPPSPGPLRPTDSY
ncbi:hypothetical protein PGTUg99_011402 [Puccinia graminis f. sp. tritici]|uniref:Uncharacterized protein n=1 Tax=Puccinia graminis f. sp. tritici TaxID=56615 RepID=A0A5B0MH46_PUCGR|nr:hypothetical protein PGTUg99_011402 [Puccinia graminis f. sp. tritici]